MPVRSSRQRGAHRRGQQRARRDVERQEGALGAAGDGERGAQGERLELLAEPDAMRLREPLVRAAARLGLEARRAPRSRRRGPWRAPRPAGRRSGSRSTPRSSSAAISVRCSASGRTRAAHVAHASARGRSAWPSTARRRAFSSSTAASTPSAGAAATPAEAASGRPRTVSSASAARARSAQSSAASASTPGRISTNSSPPRRPDDVVGAHDRAQPLGGGGQHPVALGVAERVVDDLEVVEIDQHDRDRPAGARAPARSRSWQARWFSSPVSPSRLTCSRSVSRWRAESYASAAIVAKRSTSSTSSSRERRVDARRGRRSAHPDAVARQQRHAHEGLGLVRRAGDDVRERLLAACSARCASAGCATTQPVMPVPSGIGFASTSSTQLPTANTGRSSARRLVDLVDRQVVVVQQRAQMMRDPAQRPLQRVRREDPGRRLDQRFERRATTRLGAEVDTITAPLIGRSAADLDAYTARPRRSSSAGQSNRLVSGRSRVRIRLRLSRYPARRGSRRAWPCGSASLEAFRGKRPSAGGSPCHGGRPAVGRLRLPHHRSRSRLSRAI